MPLMEKLFLLLFFLFSFAIANSTTICGNKKFSLLEVLHDVKEYSIFEIKVDSTNETYLGTLSYAKVLKTYKGNHRNNIVLNTGDRFFSGTYFLIPNAAYIIFAMFNENDGLYYAMICDYYSHPIPPSVECQNWDKDRLLYHEIVKQWKNLTETSHSGYIEYVINNNVIAKGSYKNGKPHGLWHYYNFDPNKECYYLDRRVSYENGVLNGKEERWHENFKESDSYYKNGILKSTKRYTLTKGGKTVVSNIISSTKFRKTLLYKNVSFDTLGSIIGKRSYFANKFDISKLQWAFAEIYHGDYEWKTYLNSKEYKVKGNFYLGQKVNIWKYYDLKTNELIKEEDYGNYLPRVDSSVFENFNIKFIGPKVNKKEFEGQWSFYSEDNLKNTYNFINGLVEGNSISYKTNYKKLIPYKNDNKNGIAYLISNSNDTLYCEKYINNILDSLQLTYTENWKVKEVKNFKDGLLNGEVISFGMDKNDTLFYANYINGMLHGKSFRKSPDDYIEWGSYYRNNKCGLWYETSTTSENKINYIVLKEKQTGRLLSIDNAEHSKNEWMNGNYEVIDIKSSF